MSAARLDTSPRSRLRHAFPSLSDMDVIDALLLTAGDETGAHSILRDLSQTVAERASMARKISSARVLTREQRISKAVALLTRSPSALDILQASFSKVAAEPTVEKYRKVDVNRPGVFKERVAPCPGGIELLYAVGYEAMHGHLVLQTYDARLMRSTLEALQAAKQSDAYRKAKAQATAEQARRMSNAQDEAARSTRRAAALAKVPPEPAAGDAASSACQISIFVHGERVAKRRFDSENTLEDVLSFVRSLPASPAEPFVLENITTSPVRVLDPVAHGKSSLYALDLWPIGRVQARAAA